MLQLSFLQGLSFDGCSSSQDGLTTPEVNVSRREVRQTFAIPVMVVVLDERLDTGFEVARQIVVLKQDGILQCLMPSFYLALRHRVIRCAAHVFHLMVFHPLGQFGRDVARPVVRQQPGAVSGGGTVEPRGVECLLKRLGHIFGLHRRAQPPGDDVTRVVIENGREIEPACDLEVGEVGLPQLIDRRGLVAELIGRRHHSKGRCANQVLRFEQPINARFGDEVASLIGERHRKLPGAQLGTRKRQLDNLLANRLRHTIPHPTRTAAAVFES